MILLDTNALLFYLFKADQLSDAAMNTITYSDEAWVSIASFWEIAIKQSIGKMQFCMTIPELESLCLDRDIQVLPIQSTVLEQIKSLPKIHGDPFDRLIIAQAQVGKMTIVTRDRMIPQYPVPTTW